MFDLLNHRNELAIMESAKNKVEVPGLREVKVSTKDELSDVINYGREQRCTEATVNNNTSSRSHAI